MRRDPVPFEAMRASFVIPETPSALSGIVAHAGVRGDPVSAQRHCVPQCARDDTGAQWHPTLGATRSPGRGKAL